MAGLLDDEDDLSIDEFFTEHEPVVDEKTVEDEDKKAEKEEFERQKRELAEVKAQLSELRNKSFAAVSQPAPQTPSQVKSLREKIREKLDPSNFNLEDAITLAAEEAFNAAQSATRGRSSAVQNARVAITKFLDETTMTGSARKEFDKILSETTDETLAYLQENKQIDAALQAAYENAEGRAIIKTKNTRGAEPPVYSTGSGPSFGNETAPVKRVKLSQEQKDARKQAAEIAASMGFTKKQTEEMLGDI